MLVLCFAIFFESLKWNYLYHIYIYTKKDPLHCINELHRHLGKDGRKIFRNVDICINLSHSF